MEFALYLSGIESLYRLMTDKNLALPALPGSFIETAAGFERKFTRLYFGQEFCERLIPEKNSLQEIIEFSKSRAMELTLVTPFVTEDGLGKWFDLAGEFACLNPGGEVVFNDLGLFDKAVEELDRINPVLGRLLTKQKRGPRILRLAGKVPGELIEHFSRFNADVPHLSDFYRECGFSRIELDNTLQGIIRDGDMPASLYYPYVYISTARMCITNQCKDRTKIMRCIFPCKKECREIHFKINHNEVPVDVILAGNTQFIKNPTLPDNLEELHIDRLVYQYEIPL